MIVDVKTVSSLGLRTTVYGHQVIFVENKINLIKDKETGTSMIYTCFGISAQLVNIV